MIPRKVKSETFGCSSAVFGNDTEAVNSLRRACGLSAVYRLSTNISRKKLVLSQLSSTCIKLTLFQCGIAR